MERSEVLLRACLDLLTKCDESRTVEDVMFLTTIYDDATCDGFCLKDDIESYLEFKV